MLRRPCAVECQPRPVPTLVARVHRRRPPGASAKRNAAQAACRCRARSCADIPHPAPNAISSPTTRMCVRIRNNGAIATTGGSRHHTDGSCHARPVIGHTSKSSRGVKIRRQLHTACCARKKTHARRSVRARPAHARLSWFRVAVLHGKGLKGNKRTVRNAQHADNAKG